MLTQSTTRDLLDYLLEGSLNHALCRDMGYSPLPGMTERVQEWVTYHAAAVPRLLAGPNPKSDHRYRTPRRDLRERALACLPEGLRAAIDEDRMFLVVYGPAFNEGELEGTVELIVYTHSDMEWSFILREDAVANYDLPASFWLLL